MTAYLVEMFGISLALTLAVELPITYLLGLRSKESLVLVLLVNVLTNPPAVLMCYLGSIYLTGFLSLLTEPAMEAAVIFTEACIYKSFSNVKDSEIKCPLLLSAAANLCSWIIGR